MRATRMFPVAVLLITTGCGPVYRYTTDVQAAPKPSDCDFLVTATTDTANDYLELGVVELKRDFQFARNIEKFKDVIGDQVCEAGGDLVVGQINGAGVYVRGVVFKRKAKEKKRHEPAPPQQPSDD